MRRSTPPQWSTRFERGDPQLFLIGPPPDFDCILSISRLGGTYVIEDGAGRVLFEQHGTQRLAEQAAAALRRRKAEALMADGVTLVDPASTYIDVDVEIGRDARIDPGCVISGPSRLGARVHVKAHSVIESSEVGDDVVLGPMAHLRPGCRLGRGVRIGNFVEVKNSRLGAGVKADHLAYIGDAQVGDGASFGCGRGPGLAPSKSRFNSVGSPGVTSTDCRRSPKLT